MMCGNKIVRLLSVKDTPDDRREQKCRLWRNNKLHKSM